MDQLRIFLLPSLVIFASVITSKIIGTVSITIISSSSTKDSMSITTSKEFGSLIGSIFDWAVLVISNSKKEATSKVVIKFVFIPSV